ncbi:alpha/beta fold hydrolase [uncultured Sphingomonas sp.]|uniref:alpha/beta fold hydrolase n=1 Tax=uncultured Sphingomonas sp. TaxID=158754 RepID=UPI0035CAEDC7
MTQNSNDAAAPTLLKRIGMTALGVGAAGAGLAAISALLGRDAERKVPADGGFVEIDGARLHYIDRGTGPAIVMVHGLGGQLRNFTYALSELIEGEHRLIVVDRPGSGYSKPKPGTNPDIRAQGRLVARLVDKLGLERPLIVGHSLGGAVALAAALAAPGKIGGLLLLAPLTQPMDQVPEVFRRLQRDSALSRKLIARTVGVPMGMLTSKPNLTIIFAPDPVPSDFGTRGGGLLALRPGNIEAAMHDIFAARDDMDAITRRYGELALPVSILFGRGDRLLDPELHGRTTAAAIAGAVFEVIEGGHMLPITHPDECARVLRAVLARIDR